MSMEMGYLPPVEEDARPTVWLPSDEVVHAVGTVIDVTGGV